MQSPCRRRHTGPWELWPFKVAVSRADDPSTVHARPFFVWGPPGAQLGPARSPPRNGMCVFFSFSRRKSYCEARLAACFCIRNAAFLPARDRSAPRGARRWTALKSAHRLVFFFPSRPLFFFFPWPWAPEFFDGLFASGFFRFLRPLRNIVCQGVVFPGFRVFYFQGKKAPMDQMRKHCEINEREVGEEEKKEEVQKVIERVRREKNEEWWQRGRGKNKRCRKDRIKVGRSNPKNCSRKRSPKAKTKSPPVWRPPLAAPIGPSQARNSNEPHLSGPPIWQGQPGGWLCPAGVSLCPVGPFIIGATSRNRPMVFLLHLLNPETNNRIRMIPPSRIPGRWNAARFLFPGLL